MRTLLAALLLLPSLALAGNSTGGIQWLDPLGYAKPTFLPIALPTIVTDYWIDMTGGTNSSTCGTSTANACATLRGLICGTCGTARNLVGLRGNVADGAAAINIKGTGGGAFYSFDSGAGIDNGLAGTAGKEILIRPWGTTAVTFNRGGQNQGLNGTATSIHHIIIDGGNPSTGEKLFNFVNDDNCDVCYVLAITGSNITVARSNFRATGTLRPELSTVCNTDGINCDNVGYINNEFYSNNLGNDQSNAVYYGACLASGGCSMSNGFIKNNVIRDQGGECVEVNPRTQSAGMMISGNAMHNCGKKSCGGGFDCRPAITLGINQSGTLDDVVVQNNIMWDLGVGCVWDNTGSTSTHVAKILNNTCYDYHKSTASGVCVQGICASGATGHAIIRNNIIYAPNGTDPLDGSPFTADHNLCGSGKSCGTSSKVWSP